MQEKQMAQDNLILKIRSGAQLYGTVTPTSDADYIGIFIPNKEYVIGIKRCDQVILNEKNSKSLRNNEGDVDYTVYSLPKFIQLAMGNNPNIIEIFFANHTCTLFENEFGKRLRAAYSLFISKKAYHTFKGYAYSQRRKLETKKENMTGRTELANKYGYDVKFASHLVRLLLECQQILSESKLNLPLPQNNLVLDIKLGKYSLEWVLNKANELEQSIDRIYETSTLQHSANKEAINKLQMELLEDFWGK